MKKVFVRYRFFGAHGKSNWKYDYLGSEDKLVEYTDKIDAEMEVSGCFRDYEAEAIAHPGNDFLRQKIQEFKAEAKHLESEAIRFEGLLTDRNLPYETN